MSIHEIEAAIMKLSAKELTELAAWFAEYHHSRWDEQIAQDLGAGRLDVLLAEVEEEYERGDTQAL